MLWLALAPHEIIACSNIMNKILLIFLCIVLVAGVSLWFSRARGTTSPLVPTGLIGVAIAPSKNLNYGWAQINLAWNPVVTSSSTATGTSTVVTNTPVAGYNIYRNGIKFGTVNIPAVPDAGLSMNTLYTYTVEAFDTSGNVSAPSQSISVKTPTKSPGSPFSIGSRVVLNNGSGMNVYSKPSTTKTTILCTQPGGVLGTITDGLNQASGYFWWSVRFETGCSGWVWQDYLSPLPLR